MPISFRISRRAKEETDTGFGSYSSMYGGRLINKNGNPNIERKGIPFFDRFSWYHTMITIPGWKFILFIFLFFTTINFGFAVIYYLLGTDHLGGLEDGNLLEKFSQTFFFSTQTFTTVGYGHIHPKGFFTSALASLEALIGLMSFALMTGLLYGRFSKPRAYIKYSENILVSPFQNGIALMFRLTPYKHIALTDAEVKMTCAMIIEEDGVKKNHFYQMELEYEKVNALNLSWTVVHPITESSPFYGLSKKQIDASKCEILVFFKAFDDSFSSYVISRTSYLFHEIVYGAKFVPMYERSTDGIRTIIHAEKLNAFKAVDISAFINIEK